MDPELDVVRQINKLAGQARPRGSHDGSDYPLRSLGIFNLWDVALVFAGEESKASAGELRGGVPCSLPMLRDFPCCRKAVASEAAFYPGPADLEFYRAQSECVFSEQSCHERRGRGLSASAGSYARMPVDGMPGRAACLFPVVCGDALSFGYSWRRRYCRGDSWGIKQTFCGCFHKKIDRSPVFII